MSLKDVVTEAWNNAFEGGYDDWLLDSEVIDVAIDMMDCDCDVEAYAYGNVEEVVKILIPLQRKAREEAYGKEYIKLRPFPRRN
jgi:hypothetical protein